MEPSLLETTPIVYDTSAVKIIHHMRLQSNNDSFRTHWHDRMEFLRIEEGEMTVFLGTSTIHAKAGDLVIISPRRAHGGRAAAQGVTYSVIMFDIRNFYNQTAASQLYLTPVFDHPDLFLDMTDHKAAVDAADRILDASGAPMADLQIVSGVYQMLQALYTQALNPLCDRSRRDTFLQEVMSYAEQHCDAAFSTEELGHYFGYTPAHFCRKFKQQTGLTPTQYLLIFRTEKAYSYIKAGFTDVGELSRKCGFNDTNYFTRSFKAHFGHPPTYYIKAQKNI